MKSCHSYHILSGHSSESISVPKKCTLIDFHVAKLKELATTCGQGSILSPVVSVGECRWMLEIYPRGRNSHDAEHLSFVLRNVTTRPQRATFHMYVRYRVAFQSSREDYAYKLAAESPFAAILEPSGCRSDQWAHDTSIAYADIIDPNLGYLHNGILHLALKVTVYDDDSVESLQHPSDAEMRRRNILDILQCLEVIAQAHKLARNLRSQLHICQTRDNNDSVS